MSLRKKTKQQIKRTLKRLVPVADRVFYNPSVRNKAIGVASAFLGRYAKHGENAEVAVPRVYSGPWEFMLDTPKVRTSTVKDVYVSGWLVAKAAGVTPKLRISSPAGAYQAIDYGIDRSDVASILRQRLRTAVPNKCGFGTTVAVEEDGEYAIEVSLDKGRTWQKLVKFYLAFNPDLPPKDLVNPALAYNMAEHYNLIANKKAYFFEPAKTEQFHRSTSDPKLVALYLPQFHPFPENDAWWGKGFTEWTNVGSALPRFIGHEQPKQPTDLGYYDLRNEDVIREQVELAKQHGVYGFCFYYYWFSGKRLLERPIDSFVKHQEWDFNFMICWANENWTRRWDGRDQDVLIRQEHKRDDPLTFIKDVEHILLDPRYIRVDGEPVLMVYRAKDLLEPATYAQVWREYFQQHHGTGLHLVAVQSFDNADPRSYGFDKGLEFVPLSLASRLKSELPRLDVSSSMLDLKYTGAVYDYRRIALDLDASQSDFPAYKSVMPAWDNDARKKGAGGVFQNANPDIYGHWLAQEIKRSGDDLIFINAWNEWAEGAFLEPDAMYGHAYLNRTVEVMSAASRKPENRQHFPLYGMTRQPQVRAAVVVHLFYTELWPQFVEGLARLAGLEYDLFITLPQKNAAFKDDILRDRPDAHVVVTPNRGRDVLPFVHLGRRLYELGYQYVLKMHTKKSTHRDDGHMWMADMFKKLLPAEPDRLGELVALLETERTGIVGPYGHYISMDEYFGSNRDRITYALDDVVGHDETNRILKDIEHYGFFAGTMFWARLDALAPIFNQFYQAADFESEAGQVDGTLAHALERLFTIVPLSHGRSIFSIDDHSVMKLTNNASTHYQYAQNKAQQRPRH